MKEYPANFLEVPANKQKEGSENIVFESIMLLQNKVYNPIFQMFFENQQDVQMIQQQQKEKEKKEEIMKQQQQIQN